MWIWLLFSCFFEYSRRTILKEGSVRFVFDSLEKQAVKAIIVFQGSPHAYSCCEQALYHIYSKYCFIFSFFHVSFFFFCTSERRLQVCLFVCVCNSSYQRTSPYTHSFCIAFCYIAYVNWLNVHLHFHLLHVSKMHCSVFMNQHIQHAVTVLNA